MKLDHRRMTQTTAIECCRQFGLRYRINRHCRVVLGRLKATGRIVLLDVMPDERYVAPRRRSLEPRSAQPKGKRNRLRQNCLPFTYA